MTDDIFTPLERGLARITELLKESTAYDDVLIYQQRLIENIEENRQYGSDERTRSERARIVAQLDRLSRSKLNMTFRDLCRGNPLPDAKAAQYPIPAAEGQAEVDERVDRTDVQPRMIETPARSKHEDTPPPTVVTPEFPIEETPAPLRATLLQTLEGHSDGVLRVAFSPDGQRIASGSKDQTVRLWRVGDSKQVVVLKNTYSEDVNGLAFSPNKRILAVGMTGGVQFWQIRNGEKAEWIKMNNLGHIMNVLFSSDGSLLIVADQHGVVLIWDVVHNKEVERLQGHKHAVFSAGFRFMASIKGNRIVQLYDLNNHQAIREIKAETKLVMSLAFSLDGQILAVGGDDYAIQLFDVDSGEELSYLEVREKVKDETYVRSLAFRHDSKTLAAGYSDRTVRLWNIVDGTHIAELEMPGSVSSLKFSPDGHILAVGTYCQSLKSDGISFNHESPIQLWGLE